VLASPVLALAALAVKLEDGGPVLYRQTRVGKDGSDFELLKLRTMVVGAETMGAGLSVNRGDERITRAGRLLRKLLARRAAAALERRSRGDERDRAAADAALPGRAVRRAAAAPAGREAGHHRLGAGERPRRAAVGDRIELDVWYVEHRSPLLDLRILARTPVALFRGTYKGETGGWRPES
jgi:lipopolysaccharide/colanic/teichoic acid biosynthesis glycosyltransferase